MKESGLDLMHDLNHPTLMDMKKYFTSVGGLNNNDKMARQKIKEVSRFLYYADPHYVNVRYLSDIEHINLYVSLMMEMSTIQASTVRSYLTAFEHANLFMDERKMDVTCPLSQVKCKISTMKANLRTSIRRRKAYNRSLITEERLPKLQELNKLEKLQAKVDAHLTSTVTLDDSEKHLVTTYLGTKFLLQNGQREGALCNMTLRDFNSGFENDEQGPVIYQIVVAYHKNANCTATFNLEPRDRERVMMYIENVRPQITRSNGEDDLLFVNVSGNHITNFSSDHHLYKIQERCGMSKFSLTTWRKAITTHAAHTLTDNQTINCIHELLSHSADVAEQYYTSFTTPARRKKAYLAIKMMVNPMCDKAKKSNHPSASKKDTCRQTVPSKTIPQKVNKKVKCKSIAKHSCPTTRRCSVVLERLNM
jgi:integrase